MNSDLQGRNIITATGKIKGFVRKILFKVDFTWQKAAGFISVHSGNYGRSIRLQSYKLLTNFCWQVAFLILIENNSTVTIFPKKLK